MQDRTAVRDQGVSFPLHQRDQDPGPEARAEIPQRDTVQRPLFRDPMLHDLDAALGKGVHPGSAREAQNPRDFLGALILRVDDLGQAHGVPQEGHLMQVQGIPDPGNHMFRPEFP